MALADAAAVDALRASVGLPPLALHVAQAWARAHAEGECAPADPAGRLTAQRAWAAAAGWHSVQVQADQRG